MSRSIPFQVGLATLLLFALPASALETVTTAQGALRGDRDGEVVAFKGIPYAAPPVGPLRWTAPQPPKPWVGVREATSFGPACLQPQTPGRPPLTTSEDCLTLNIWPPAIVTRTRNCR